MELEKFTHYFSLNFEYRSDLEGATKEEKEKLKENARSYLKTLVTLGGGCLEWHDTELSKDIHND